MCGIAGAFCVAGPPRRPFAQATLDAMTDAMIHRGPDDRGTHLTEGAALGARRLSVIDVEFGHQPFGNESADVWAVQNGEIYNHDLLRAELGARGHRFRSRCDTEILPHLYEDEGVAIGERLRGMFAVAVWDERRRRGLLVRDRLGVKPLYYAERDGLLLFSSELKGLLASGLVEPELDPVALRTYLTLGMVPAPLTLLKDVRKLPPGHLLVVADGRVSIDRYWQYPRVVGAVRGARPEEYTERLLLALRASVEMRLMADVPLGAMLSGGLDSSIVVALMAEQMSRPVQTFAVGFKGAPQSELGAARAVARHFGAEHHELEVEEAPDLDELVWHMDEPVADLSALGFLALCRLARRHVTVALSGQGADELFAGYRHHLHTHVVRHWRRVPLALARPALATAKRGPRLSRRFAEVASTRDAAERALAAKRISDPADVAMLLGPQPDVDPSLAAIRALPGSDIADPLAAALALDAQLGLPDDMLHYFDRASMAHSLEVRVPFLDHVLVEEVAGIPANLKLRGRTTKYLLREAARGLVPDFVIDRPKVGFFNANLTGWVAHAIDAEVPARGLADRPRYGGVLDGEAVGRLVERQRAAPTHRGAQLVLAIVLLETWLESYVPRALRVAHEPESERIVL